jgi:hypothetical protein
VVGTAAVAAVVVATEAVAIVVVVAEAVVTEEVAIVVVVTEAAATEAVVGDEAIFKVGEEEGAEQLSLVSRAATIVEEDAAGDEEVVITDGAGDGVVEVMAVAGLISSRASRWFSGLFL